MAKQTAKASTKDYPTGVFTSIFTGYEAFLSDHIIQEKKILPGMAYLEIARAAIASSVTISDQHMIVLKESVFIQPLVITEKCPVEINVYPGASREYGVEVSTDQGIHFQSKVFIQDRQKHTSETSSPTTLDIPDLKQECTIAGPTKQEIYADFKKLGLNYGPSHQGITEIKLGKDCALASLSLPGSSSRGMELNTGMLDSIIQSAAALAEFQKGVHVPFAVKSTQIYASLTDKIYAYLVKTDQGMDYTITDEKGEVKVILVGFVSRELDLNPVQDELVYYKPHWQEEKNTPKNNLDSKDITLIPRQANYTNLVKTVFKVAQKLIQDKTGPHIIEVHLAPDKPEWKGIIALLKTINLEYSKISYRLQMGDKYIKLAYKAADMITTQTYSWPDNKTILITGGLGGLSMLFAHDIAQISKGSTLILVGRSELNTDKKNLMKRLETFGSKIIYECCDLSKQGAVNSLIAKYPQINGIIHGSGIIKDNFVIKKTLGEIEQVLFPKVKGLKYLDEATAKFKLDYFITLSSIAGTLGNAGQTDYAAANGYMDAYMQNRALEVKNQKRYGKSISINWPLWEMGGMQVDEATKQNMLQVFKIRPLPATSGLTALKQIIASDEQQLLVLFGHKKAIGNMFEKMNSRTKKAQKKPPLVEMSKLTREISQEVIIQTAEHLKLQPNQLDEEADWSEFGFDSILLSSFVNKFNTQFALDLMPTALFEATNIQLFSQYLAENYPQQMAEKLSLTEAEQPDTKTAPLEQDQVKISAFAQGFKKAYKTSVAYRQEDIAIVGMSCRIAGARSLEEFWQMLIEEKDMITEIPIDRWNWHAYPDSSKWGSFIDGVAEFDSLFFGISPAEAMYMAPEQRLMMQYVWECLENAGCGGDSIKGTNTGIFVGCGASSYSSLLSKMPIQAYSSTGIVPSVGPNRISYLMDWHGPSEPIETACSSSLVAIHRAVEAIRGGHCEQAIAGGVNLLLTPEAYISFTKAGMLCEDGRCKTFSDQANGYVRGEGIGMLLLKPLKIAIQEGNIIHALVKGTAENHGGRTNSLTAPNPKSQSAVIQKAIADADVDFSRISYIECHGTGTELGDPVEIEGLKTVSDQLLEDKERTHTCKLGSIKSNIGHLEMAAGIVGVIKVVLQMQHKKIAKSLHCEKINSYIDLSNSPYEVAQNASEWQVTIGKTRVGGVSSFGFGGVNSHVVLEEFQEPALAGEEEIQDSTNHSSQLLLISARTEESLLNYVSKYPTFIKTLPKNPTTLKRLAYTLQIGRSEMQERLVFIVKSLDEWADLLDSFLESKGKVNHRNIYKGTVKSSATDNLEIGDTEAGKEYINKLIDTHESGKLAELWVKGTQINWENLHM